MGSATDNASKHRIWRVGTGVVPLCFVNGLGARGMGSDSISASVSASTSGSESSLISREKSTTMSIGHESGVS